MSDTTPEVDVDQLATELDGGATLIDVREASEYADGHVPGAKLIPMGQLPDHKDSLGGSSVYVICASGNRSAAMTDFLTSGGIDAYSVAGGTKGWAESGRPIETGAPS